MATSSRTMAWRPPAKATSSIRRAAAGTASTIPRPRTWCWCGAGWARARSRPRVTRCPRSIAERVCRLDQATRRPQELLLASGGRLGNAVGPPKSRNLLVARRRSHSLADTSAADLKFLHFWIRGTGTHCGRRGAFDKFKCATGGALPHIVRKNSQRTWEEYNGSADQDDSRGKPAAPGQADRSQP